MEPEKIFISNAVSLVGNQFLFSIFFFSLSLSHFLNNGPYYLHDTLSILDFEHSMSRRI